MASPDKKLHLKFHGRIIDHLGIQMYQSPTAAIAELIANSWDADAESVEITLPDQLGEDAQIIIKDNGCGMTFDECERRYLNVGYGRRGNAPTQKSTKLRPILGRKGIGKFAGFGIARIVRIETVSAATGEKTGFELDLNQLRGEAYVAEGGEIQVEQYLSPDEQRVADHGTRIILKALTLNQKPSPTIFGRSMARRFLLHQEAADFKVFINSAPLPDEDGATVQYVFPCDYEEAETPRGLTLDGEWGVESLPNGKTVKWRFKFYRDPVDDEELQGVAIFSNGKLCQTPFYFNLTGGLSGQFGQEYLTGHVKADYLDELTTDIISPERQRVNWDHAESHPLEVWGQNRIRELFVIWKKRRAAAKVAILERKTEPFAERLEKLPAHERKIVKQAILKIAAVEKIKEEQFATLAQGFLFAWEGGRLQALIQTVAETEEMTSEELLDVLVEAKVLTALHTAEAVKAKLLVIAGLYERIRKRELENAVRDYIAKDPWLISPEWETYQKEIGVNHLIKIAAQKAKLEEHQDWKGRIDLVLRGGDNLVIVEFMRPGLKVDDDHLFRYEKYVNALRIEIQANTGLPYKKVIGFLVADELSKDALVIVKLQQLQSVEMYAYDWKSLLRQAAFLWKDFFTVLVNRSPDDERLIALAEHLDIDLPLVNTSDFDAPIDG